MKYAREHVKRYWIFAYRRALGISMVTFAITLAIGMIFTSLFANTFYVHPVAELAFWAFLIIITTMTLIVSFTSAHLSSVKLMTEHESHQHSKYVAVWLFSIIVGIVVFTLPLVFINSFIAPLMFLFSFGGILWVLYISVTLLFRHSYRELAYGATALLIIFAISMLAVTGSLSSTQYYLNAQVYIAATLFVAMATLIIVFGGTGMMLMFNSTNEFVKEFEDTIHLLEGRPVPAPVARSRAKARGRTRRKR